MFVVLIFFVTLHRGTALAAVLCSLRRLVACVCNRSGCMLRFSALSFGKLFSLCQAACSAGCRTKAGFIPYALETGHGSQQSWRIVQTTDKDIHRRGQQPAGRQTEHGIPISRGYRRQTE